MHLSAAAQLHRASMSAHSSRLTCCVWLAPFAAFGSFARRRQSGAAPASVRLRVLSAAEAAAAAPPSTCWAPMSSAIFPRSQLLCRNAAPSFLLYMLGGRGAGGEGVTIHSNNIIRSLRIAAPDRQEAGEVEENPSGGKSRRVRGKNTKLLGPTPVDG